MVGFDYVVIAIIGLSALISLFRGFVREFIALVSWVAAVFLCTRYTSTLASLVPDSVTESVTVKSMLAAVALFTVTIVAGYLVYFLAKKIIKTAQLSLSDRLLGVVFGVCRGGVLAVLCIALAGFTTLPQERWWPRSEMVNLFTPMAKKALQYMPESFRSRNQLITPQPAGSS